MVKSILLVEEDDMESEYGSQLLSFLKNTKFLIGDKINMETNIAFRSGDPAIEIFNIFLKKLYNENTVRIIISLNKI